MIITEKGWGIIYLFSGIFVLIVSIWDFPIFYVINFLLLFRIYNILIFIIELIFGVLFIRLSVKSFKFAKEGLDGEESTNLLSKIIVWASNLFQIYMIYQTIFTIFHW
ncbi:MAG: hypothetical protein R3255_06295 [Candidatus Lokiarchaeia archaeon]|nr:hypothetical protein [Candidatus Lokiarchaeia archaeon]